MSDCYSLGGPLLAVQLAQAVDMLLLALGVGATASSSQVLKGFIFYSNHQSKACPKLSAI